MRRLAAAVALAAASGAAAAQGWFQFAVIGDAPYFAFEEPQVAATLQALAKQPVAFVIHVGDIKGGGTPCSDAVFADRHALLDASPLPLVLTPGDNEWTDCHRSNAGGYDPIERLGRLRAVFFSADESLGRRRIAVERQPGRPENARWRHDGVQFVTLNVPGSENNARMPKEREARMADNAAWLAAAATRAARADTRALVIVMHAEPGFGRAPSARDPYASLRRVLGATATRLGKPVLLVHGDDHRHAFDHPFGGRVPNLLRVSPYGSPGMAPAIVSVDPTVPRLFEARTGLTP